MLAVSPGRRGDLLAVGANLCAHGHHAVRSRTAPPGMVPGDGIDAQELSGSDHDGVGARLHLDHVAGLATSCRLAEVEAATLPDSERVGAVVLPDFRSVDLDDVARLHAEAAGQPRAGIAVRDETDVVAVRLSRDIEPARCGFRTDLRLGSVAQGEERPGQLVRVEYSENIGLVLGHVHGAV